MKIYFSWSFRVSEHYYSFNFYMWFLPSSKLNYYPNGYYQFNQSVNWSVNNHSVTIVSFLGCPIFMWTHDFIALPGPVLYYQCYKSEFSHFIRLTFSCRFLFRAVTCINTTFQSTWFQHFSQLVLWTVPLLNSLFLNTHFVELFHFLRGLSHRVNLFYRDL